MKQRVEDLGRIAAYVEKILDDDIFQEMDRPMNPKNIDGWFERFKLVPEDTQVEYLENLFYSLRGMEIELQNILSIANGEYEED